MLWSELWWDSTCPDIGGHLEDRAGFIGRFQESPLVVLMKARVGEYISLLRLYHKLGGLEMYGFTLLEARSLSARWWWS